MVTYCTIEDVKVEEECLAYLMQGSIILQAHKYSQDGVQYWATGQTFLEYENAPSDHLCENLCSEATFPGLDSVQFCAHLLPHRLWCEGNNGQVQFDMLLSRI